MMTFWMIVEACDRNRMAAEDAVYEFMVTGCVPIQIKIGDRICGNDEWSALMAHQRDMMMAFMLPALGRRLKVLEHGRQ